MKRKRNKDYNRAHTLQRLRERYDMDLTEEDYERLCRVTKTFGCLVAREADMHQEIIDVKFNEATIRVVWDTERKIVRTVLPL